MGNRLLAGLLVLALVSAGTVAGTTMGRAQHGGQSTAATAAAAAPTEITSCTTISEPGRYVLAADLQNRDANTCIRIRASDVVLDGNGHVVDGRASPDADRLSRQFFAGRANPLAPRTSVGVAATGDRRRSNVTVTDLRVTDWRWGVVANGLRSSRIVDVRASNVGFGVVSARSWGVRIADVAAVDNAVVGVGLFEAARSRLANVTASGNGLVGVYRSGGRNATLSAVVARNNDLAGVLLDGTTDADLAGANASGNRIGVYLFGATGTDVTGATAVDNRLAGVYAIDAAGTTIRDGVAARNRLAGVLLENTTGSRVMGTNASDNRIGVFAANGTGTTIRDGTARRNRLAGVLFQEVANGRVVGANASRNQQYGVFLYGTAGATVVDSNASDQFAGVYVANATGGAVVDNVVLNTSFAGVYVTNSTGVRVANNRNGLMTFESTDDGIGEEGGIRHDEDIAVNQSNGLTDDELRRYVYRSIARVEHLRQLEFTESITLDVVDRDRFERQAAATPSVGGEQSAWENQYWEALFVAGEDRNATQILENESTRILGSYYRDSRRLTLVSDADPPVVDGTTLVHELVHALQGQHFDVDRPGDRPRSEDELRGSLGLTEGDAEYVAMLYEKYCGVVWNCVQTPSKTPPGGEVPADRNFARRAIVLSPYSDGPQLIATLRERGGWAAVDEAYEHPPNSTEQFLHPERRNETPVPLAFESTARDGWQEFDPENLTGPTRDGRTTVGEVGIFAMFWYQGYEYGIPVVSVENHLVPNDAPFDLYNYTSPPSVGWGNDVLVPYRKETPNGTAYGYVWQTAWDTPRDAEEFHRAYRRTLLGHGAEQVGPNTWVIESGPFADAFRVVRNGTSVTVVNAPTVEALDDLRPNLGADADAAASASPNGTATNGTASPSETTTATEAADSASAPN
ncbi:MULTISPECIES: Hvo_1808 family surface protein [Halorussus]|uniref:Hvo_1808 family surface protein n=1 Tax=Halorussus TaxID=1070314 RepID=UPI0020A21B07|nr:Hvo_1808 family surface protein [Halorussus vallis]USZ74405.1 Hvo_1808 family surface protein [Halorussus vallis]